MLHQPTRVPFEVTSLISLYELHRERKEEGGHSSRVLCVPTPAEYCLERTVEVSSLAGCCTYSATQWICTGWNTATRPLVVCMNVGACFLHACKPSAWQLLKCTVLAGCGGRGAVTSEKLVTAGCPSSTGKCSRNSTSYTQAPCRSRAPYLGTGIPASQTRPCSKQNINTI